MGLAVISFLFYLFNALSFKIITKEKLPKHLPAINKNEMIIAVK
jgi:hypothetical protein